MGLASVTGAVVLAQGSLAADHVTQAAVQPRCVYTTTTTTCVAAGSSVDLQRVSNLVTPYVELLEEFGLNPPSRFFLSGASAPPRTYLKLSIPAGSPSPPAVVNQQIATVIAGPRPCSTKNGWVLTSVRHARALLTWWLLRQVIGLEPARVTSTQGSWLVSDQSSQWVLSNYAAIADCARAVQIPALYAKK